MSDMCKLDKTSKLTTDEFLSICDCVGRYENYPDTVTYKLNKMNERQQSLILQVAVYLTRDIDKLPEWNIFSNR